jgi:precorrin-3B synthase
MSAGAEVKGWCPGALRPMMSGDGLVVRVRPFGARLTRAQVDGLATLAAAHGNGLIDLSSRGNVQVRGVTEESHPKLISGLQRMGLVDATETAERRRNLIVTPFWLTGDGTERFTTELTQALAAPDAPDLPYKFGFAVDTGQQPVLQTASADIRLERDAGAGYILVADGAAVGKPVTSDTIVAEAIALARWFMDNRGEHRRMRKLLAAGADLPPGHFVPRQEQEYQPKPGFTPLGAMVALALGQLQVDTLASLAKHGGVRLTPWRMLLVESARRLPEIEGLITDPDDPLLRVVACTGAPRCLQGHAETRPLARQLASRLPSGQFLHISGCAKGCGHPGKAPLTITATPDGFDLIEDGRAADTPARRNLTPDDIFKAV